MSYAEALARIGEIQRRLGPPRVQPSTTSPASADFGQLLAAARMGSAATTHGPSAPVVAAPAGTEQPSPAAPAASQPSPAERSQRFLASQERLDGSELVDLLRGAGFTGEGLRTAWALAMRESGGRPGALGRVNGDGTRDHGLFQLNDVHVGRDIAPGVLYDPVSNAAAAYRMSKGGASFGAWGLGSTGWAGHLQRTAPATYASLQSSFQQWYERFPVH